VDFNQLLHNHQIALMEAARLRPAGLNSDGHGANAEHRIGLELVDHCAQQIELAREKLGVGHFGLPVASAHQAPDWKTHD